MGEFHSWGKIMVLNETDTYSCKEITVYKGQKFSLADYIGMDLDGTWHCVSGRGTITIPSRKKCISLFENKMNLQEFRSAEPEDDLYLTCWQHSDIVIVEVIRKSFRT
jgi:RNAse (barnase) inhibitor barstar